MLLDGEGAGVKGDTKDLDTWDDAGPEADDGEGDELGYNLWKVILSMLAVMGRLRDLHHRW